MCTPASDIRQLLVSYDGRATLSLVWKHLDEGPLRQEFGSKETAKELLPRVPTARMALLRVLSDFIYNFDSHSPK